MRTKHAIIIGAGPAGLTAALELLKKTDIRPIILEKSGDIGGISKTINYKGNRMDIGGHRFFSKSDRVMQWWLDIMPLEQSEDEHFTISYQNKSREISATANKHESTDKDLVMLVRNRLSRIYFLRRFFTYPIQLSIDTLIKLGLARTVAIMFSYVKAQLFPRKPETSLEDFMINRFGKTLYKLFFQDYTEKVWGLPCNKISAEWGAQRIKGISISKALQHAIQTTVRKTKRADHHDISQKGTETSLIEKFLYPKYGPGQLWEEVARQVVAMGGEILMNQDVNTICRNEQGNAVTGIRTTNTITGEISYLEGDYFFSTMPVKELIGGMDGSIPGAVRDVASGLQYRDFITTGILLKKLSFKDQNTGEWKPLELKDTWIYIQEKDVKVGRLQIFNNWSPFMVKDPENTWVGMEFFCNETDEFWNLPDKEIEAIAIGELEKIGLACSTNVLDATVIRVQKTYPAYFGTYEQFDQVRAFTDSIPNLFLIGRNGMHKYNNSDHSMLTAMVAVDNICEEITTKENIWSINTEQEYHEEKTTNVGDQERSADGEIEFDISPVRRKEPIVLWNFIKGQVNNLKYFRVAIVAIILQFIFFKLLYPFADFSQDSYVYLKAAYNNENVSFRPIGYSKFLRAFSALTTSDVLLTGFQFLLLEAAALYFFYTIRYFLKPSENISRILFVILVFNPVTLYMANYISSDGIFAALSLIWLTHLIWLFNAPGLKPVLLNGVLLFLILGLRYNALFYPIIAIGVFSICTWAPWKKMLAAGYIILLTFGLIKIIQSENYHKNGISEFSSFGGWQMANNALYMYRNFPSHNNMLMKTPDTKELESIVHHYFDTVKTERKYPPLEATDYMWNDDAPLRQFWHKKITSTSMDDSVRAWFSVGPVFAKYGSALISTYPLDFARYFIWPNLKAYMLPKLEVFERYNIGMDSVHVIAKQWFRYKTEYVHSNFKKKQAAFLSPAPLLFSLSNIIFIPGLLFALFKRPKSASKNQLVFFGILGGFFLVNLAFSIASAPVVFRYQYFPMIIAICGSVLLSTSIIKEYNKKNKTSINNKVS